MHDQNNLPQHSGTSPFDAIRRVTPEGREYWSARELMPMLGYEEWRKFAGAIDRARISASNAGHTPSDHFVGAAKMVETGSNAVRRIDDRHLSRFACYLVAQNGDPRKPAIADAQSYFAIKTRQAEVAAQERPTFLIPKTYAGALRAAAEQAERAELAEQQNKALTARIEKDAPLVAKAESHSNADNASINRQAFAREVQQWGLLQGVKVLQEHVYEVLRQHGMLVAGNRSDRNHATAQAVKAGWAWTKKDTTPEGYATATTYIRAKGQDLAWKWITDHVREFGDLRPRGVA
ncbi:phage antirepressor KilAC domain-containing protein [Williamsia serinedens]|uniref:DNA-damage-inducible protein D n=1 Tax=Williamsia serinedens TaxID=391736 RepID=A0ABT1H7J1_9NOCA|nr:phage antirepressor KilAC domain-containing protein [Williamsia serinedens]MCP2163111.1 DNA-damage-inducible protein D [Williamsia serinedens]